jgi:hypothetical protein
MRERSADSAAPGETRGDETAAPAATVGNADPAVALAMTLGRAAGNRALARVIAAQRRVLARDPNTDYADALKRADWPAAAEHLNGFSRADILKRLIVRTPEEVGKLHQGALDNPKVGPQSQLALLTPPLLTAFSLQFRDAAELVRSSTEAMKLVAEAVTANVKYGGFSEDGPAKSTVGAHPYTVGDSIYVPKTRLGDKVMAAKGFLFESNNAIRRPRFAAISTQASEGKLNADQFASGYIGLEVEGMLRMGGIWNSFKPILGGGKELDKYDADYYMPEFTAVQSGKKTAADITTEVGARKYTAGVNVGKTVTQYYVEQFNARYAKKAK